VEQPEKAAEESKADEPARGDAPRGRGKGARRGAPETTIAPKDDEATEKARKAKEEAERLRAEDEARAL
jgi:hypothetical protein